MIFDIRDQIKAQKTLLRITGVPFSIWNDETDRNYAQFEYVDDFLKFVVYKYGTLSTQYQELEFVFSHLTSSSNECKSIRKYGLQDLSETIVNEHSELREYLLGHNVLIDLERALLLYKGRQYDIHEGRLSLLDSEEVQKCKRIGYRLYKDYCVCGFLSIDPNSPYLTRVDKQPEILIDIGDLIGKAIDQEWALSHQSYEVIAKVSSKDVICESEQPTDEDKLICYLSYAYFNALGDQDERHLLCNNGVSIPPEQIIDVKPFKMWH